MEQTSIKRERSVFADFMLSSRARKRDREAPSLGALSALATYWARAFPLDQLEPLLTCHGMPLETREFCLQIAKGTVFLRNDAFPRLRDLRARLVKEEATRLELGPMYPDRGRKETRNSNANPMLQRFIWFDMDINDWENRECLCDESKPQMCARCWSWYMVPAMRVLDLVLRERLGFSRLMWVFSGRRGVHCAVLDPWVIEAYADPLRHTDKSLLQREALFASLAYENIGDSMRSRVLGEILEPHVAKLAWPGRRERNECQGDKEERERYLVKRFYPILDKQVTCKVGHLVKCPFSPHSNGNVSVPFDLGSAVSGEFDPIKGTPTIDQCNKDPSILQPFVRTMQRALYGKGGGGGGEAQVKE